MKPSCYWIKIHVLSCQGNLHPQMSSGIGAGLLFLLFYLLTMSWLGKVLRESRTISTVKNHACSWTHNMISKACPSKILVATFKSERIKNIALNHNTLVCSTRGALRYRGTYTIHVANLVYVYYSYSYFKKVEYWILHSKTEMHYYLTVYLA